MDGEGITYLKSLEPWRGVGDFTLERVLCVCRQMGNPQDSCPTIHIAGSNGKGSVSALLGAILRSAGLSVGVTTSPHLSEINERISIDGQLISDRELDSLALELRAVCSSASIQLSFFEGITVVAFLAFSRRRVDYAVVEVGLGGRLDATNVISRPVAAAITSISLEHKDILGDSLERIAREKAGIIKRGAPVVVGRMPDTSLNVIRRIASDNESAFWAYGEDFISEPDGEANVSQFGQRIVYRDKFGAMNGELSLLGEHQLSNAGVALRVARHLNIPEEACLQGLRVARWPGRLETCRRADGGVVIMDAAHNPEGAQVLSRYLSATYRNKVRMIFGVLRTKEWRLMLTELIPRVSSWYLVSPNSEGGVESCKVAEFLSEQGVSWSDIRIFGDPDREGIETLLNSTFETLSPDIPVVATGSIYLLGRLRSQMLKRSIDSGS